MGQQQTAADFFYDFIKIHCDNDVELYETCVRALKQTKQMEKEQKIEFAKHCLNKALDLDTRTAYKNVEKYYKQTYVE
jgi:hypothetical protein